MGWDMFTINNHIVLYSRIYSFLHFTLLKEMESSCICDRKFHRGGREAPRSGSQDLPYLNLCNYNHTARFIILNILWHKLYVLTNYNINILSLAQPQANLYICLKLIHLINLSNRQVLASLKSVQCHLSNNLHSPRFKIVIYTLRIKDMIVAEAEPVLLMWSLEFKAAPVQLQCLV